MQRSRKLHPGVLVLLFAIATPMALRADGPKRDPPPPWPPISGRELGTPSKKPHLKAQRQEPPVYRQENQDPRHRRNDHQAVWQQQRERHWKSEHRGWRERGGYRGHRIPEQQFHSRFGPTHLFRVALYPVRRVSGYIQFQYGGFGFSVVDPVPEHWSSHWYDDDDMYIVDADDGYYMHNRRYPQDRIAISVSIR